MKKPFPRPADPSKMNARLLRRHYRHVRHVMNMQFAAHRRLADVMNSTTLALRQFTEAFKQGETT